MTKAYFLNKGVKYKEGISRLLTILVVELMRVSFIIVEDVRSHYEKVVVVVVA